jgi:hypothetical protein
VADDKVAGAGPMPHTYSHRMLAQKPIQMKGGTARVTDSTVFPAATTIAAAFVEAEPGGIGELHRHPNANEMPYYISGRARFGSKDKVEVIGMPPEEECECELFVSIRWGADRLAMPLTQLKPTAGTDERTKEAIADWHYWLRMGYKY